MIWKCLIHQTDLQCALIDSSKTKSVDKKMEDCETLFDCKHNVLVCYNEHENR